MRRTFRLLAVLAVAVAGPAQAQFTAPLSLHGMGIQKQWFDTESGFNEMPGFVWGNSDAAAANNIGMYVRFNNGTSGSIAYTGLSGRWNTSSGSAFGTLISANGFFGNYANAGLHILRNSPAGGTLPIAWTNNPATPFGSNVELDYTDNSVRSEFRVTTPGWTSVEITTYSSSAAAVTVTPEPASLALFGSGLAGMAGLGAVRRRRKNSAA